jgi:glycosyltransferase involved in cell wall biosynthesis
MNLFSLSAPARAGAPSQAAEMRIALFTDADIFAGTERHMLELALALRQKQLEVTLACPEHSPLANKGAVHGLRILAIEKKGLIDRDAIRILAGELASNRIDVVHAHNGRTLLSAVLAVGHARRGRCLATQHFLEPDHRSRSGPRGALHRQAHRWTNRRTHHFIAISEAARRRMLARKDAPENRISVIPHGISVPDGSNLRSPLSLRSEWGVAVDTPVVACIARLQPEKDVGSLVAAMARVLKQAPETVCVIAGDGPLRPALQNEIDRLRLGANVRLLGYQSDALSVMRAADMVVLPSLSESFGLVLVEAMALARPVIATRVGGPQEVVAEHETGLLAPPGDPQALGEAILALMGDSALRTAMGARGRERFETHYTADRMAEMTRAVYARLLPAESGLAG